MHTPKIIFSAALSAMFVLLPVSLPAQIEHGRQADTAKECAICHFRWVATFFEEHRGTPLAPLQEVQVVGDQEMCVSCHDGAVMDSRDRICNDPGHRVGIRPSSRIWIPEKFPLDQNGGLLCTTCHTPHALTSESGPLVEFFLRAPNENSSFCKQCHRDNAGGKEQGNHPVDVAAPLIPKPILEAGGRLGTDPPQQIICETCHIPHGGVNNKFLVLPEEDPQTRSVLCEVCHTKKPGRSPDAAVNRYSHPLDLLPGKAVHIPQQWSNGEKVVLGTGGELVCRTCHKPHYAVDRQYLLADHKGKDHLCLQCHREQSRIAGSRHDLGRSAPDARNILSQKAADVGPCASCHLVHSGVASAMWARPVAESGEGADTFCASCHARGGCAENALPGQFSHPLTLPPAETVAALSLPVYDEAGRRSSAGSITCMTCHDVHNPAPLTARADAGDTVRGRFLRFGEQGPAEHCLVCHPRQAQVRDTVHDLTLHAPGFVNALGQSPGEAGVCSPCHAAHKAPYAVYLWSGPVGRSETAPRQEPCTSGGTAVVALCTGCHAPGSVAQGRIPRSGLHPQQGAFPGGGASVAATHVLDIFPLYRCSGERSPAGNIVCTTCHNPHVWAGDAGGDAIKNFLRPHAPENLCAVCHGQESLYRYLYFHSYPQRRIQDAPFAFAADRETQQ